MKPLILLIIIVVPPTSALVDCRMACRTCRENAESSSVLEVYCAMCEECKSRRRDRLRLRTDAGKQNNNHETTKDSTQHKQTHTTKTLAQDSALTHNERHVPSSDPLQQPDYQHNPQAHEIASPLSHVHQPVPRPSYSENIPVYLQGPAVVTTYSLGAYEPQPPQMYYPVSYPNGCPTPPPCYESEEEYSPLPLNVQTKKITLPTTTSTTSTTTITTTTTLQPCPQIRHCKRKRRKPRVPIPTPEIRYIRVPQPPPPQYFPQPYPCMNPCLPSMPGPACPCPQPPPPMNLPPYQPFLPVHLSLSHSQTEHQSIQPLYIPDSTEPPYRSSADVSTTTEAKSTRRNFFYVYVGVPKNVLNN